MDLIMLIDLKNVDIFIVYSQVSTVVELDNRSIGTMAIGDANGQLIRDNCDVGHQTSNERFSCFFNTDLFSFYLILSSFVKLDPLGLHNPIF